MNTYKKIVLILTTIWSVGLFSTTLYAQTTDNKVTLGGVSPNQLQIIVYKGGYYIVNRYIGSSWNKQFYDASTTPLFTIKIGNTTFSYKGHGALMAGVTVLTPFDAITDVGTPITTGTQQEVTKRFKGTYAGLYSFTVTIKIMYNTSSPDYLIKHATIDATNIPSGTSITFAYGWDTYVNTSDKGYAYIVPDIFNLNNNSTQQDRYLTTAQVQSLRMVGASNSTGSGALIAFFPIGRVFDRGYSATPYQNGYSYNVASLTPGNGTSSGNNTQYMFQFGPFSGGNDNGTGVGYDNIPAGEITEIKTGLTFTSSLDGELDYFWNGVKNYTANVGEVVNLNLNYLSYNNSALNNVGFRVDFADLHIDTSGCISSGFTGGTTDCVAGTEFYQLNGATVQGLGSASVSVPINTIQAGQWVVDGSAITNATQTLPLGSPATLTVTTTVSLANASVSSIRKGDSIQYIVKFTGTVTAAEDVTINLAYMGDTTSFAYPASVTIPAGSNSAAFTVTALSSGEGSDFLKIALSNTNKVFATVDAPSLALVTIEYDPIAVLICKNDSITLVATPTNVNYSATYQWKKNNVYINGATDTIYSYFPANGDTISCELTYDTECNFPITISSADVIITIDNLTVEITGSDSICIGTTTQLSPTTGGTWASVNPSIASVTNGGLVTGLAAGTARFVFTSSETGCSDTTNVVSVGEFPTVEPITGANIVCVGDDIQLSCATTDGIWTLSNSNAQIIGFNTDNFVTISGTITGKTYVTYTVGAGVCQTKSTFLLKIVSSASPPQIIIGMEK